MIITDHVPNYYKYPVMGRLSVRYFLIFLIFLFTTVSINDVQGNTIKTVYERGQPGKAKKVKTKNKKVKEPRGVRKAKKEQAKKEEKIKKDYNKYVADSKKRAYQIQSPEVKERMKQNQKDITTREKNHKKKSNSSTKRAQKKYK